MESELVSGVREFKTEAYHQTLEGIHSKIKEIRFVVKKHTCLTVKVEKS